MLKKSSRTSGYIVNDEGVEFQESIRRVDLLSCLITRGMIADGL